MTTKEKDPDEVFTGWAGRMAFIFITVGTAIGFGNLWRFPALAYEYGAGAFFIPYLLALLVLGFPLMTMEVALGQFYQKGDPEAWATFHNRFRGIGLTAIFSTFVLMVYYAILLCWIIRSFFLTFKITEEQQETITGAIMYRDFQDFVVGGATLGDDNRPTRFVPENVAYYAITWFLAFMATAWGVNILGKISFFTMGLPVVLLFVFLGKALSLPGASDGLYAYLGNWDMSLLTARPEVWSEAAVQIFFSLSLVTGALTALGSHCTRDAPVSANSLIVCICNTSFSFISGMAIFASLGFQAQDEGVPISELNVGGPGLLFGSYPAVFLEMPGGLHWVRLYYVDLFLLGISSLNGLLEAIITPVEEMKPLMNINKKIIVASLCILSFFCGLIYCTDAGLFFLDTVDFYINFVFLFLGLVKCFGFSWLPGYQKLVITFGWKIIGLHWFGTFSSVFVGSIICFAKLAGDSSVGVGMITTAAIYSVCMAGVYYLCRDVKAANPTMTWKSLFYNLFFQNAIEFQNELGAVVGWLPPNWNVAIKHIVTPIIVVLFVNLACAENSVGEPLFGNFGDLVPWPYQVLGILVFSVALFIFLVGMVFPQAYLPLKPSLEDKEEEKAIVEDFTATKHIELDSGSQDNSDEFSKEDLAVEATPDLQATEVA